MLVAPLPQRHDDRVEVLARVGQEVLEPSGVVRILAALEDPGVDQGAQAGRQGVAWGADPSHHLVEPAVPEEHLAHGQQCPLLPTTSRDRATEHTLGAVFAGAMQAL